VQARTVLDGIEARLMLFYVVQKALDQQEAHWAERLQASQRALQEALERQDAHWAEQLEASQMKPGPPPFSDPASHHLTTEAATVVPPQNLLCEVCGAPAARPQKQLLHHAEQSRQTTATGASGEHSNGLQALLEEAEAELSSVEFALDAFSKDGVRAEDERAKGAKTSPKIKAGAADAGGVQTVVGSAELLAMAEAASEAGVVCSSVSMHGAPSSADFANGGEAAAGPSRSASKLGLRLSREAACSPLSCAAPQQSGALCQALRTTASQCSPSPQQVSSSPCAQPGQPSHHAAGEPLPLHQQVPSSPCAQPFHDLSGEPLPLTQLEPKPALFQLPQPATSPMLRPVALSLCDDSSPMVLGAGASHVASPFGDRPAGTPHTAASTSCAASPPRLHSPGESHAAAPNSCVTAPMGVVSVRKGLHDTGSLVDVSRQLRSSQELAGGTGNAGASLRYPTSRRSSDNAHERSSVFGSGEHSPRLALDACDVRRHASVSLSEVPPGCSAASQQLAAADTFLLGAAAAGIQRSVSVCRHDTGHARGSWPEGTAARYADTGRSEASSTTEASSQPPREAACLAQAQPAGLRLPFLEREAAVGGEVVLDRGLESFRALRAAQPLCSAECLGPSEQGIRHGGLRAQRLRRASLEVPDRLRRQTSAELRRAESADVRAALDLLRQSLDAEAGRDTSESGQAVPSGPSSAVRPALLADHSVGGDENAGAGPLNCATAPMLSFQNLVPAAHGKAQAPQPPEAATLPRGLSGPGAQLGMDSQQRSARLAADAVRSPPPPVAAASVDWSAPLPRARSSARTVALAPQPQEFGCAPAMAPWLDRLSSSAQALRRHTARVLHAHAASIGPPAPGSALERVRAAAAAAQQLPLRAPPLLVSEISSASGSSVTASVHESTSLARAAAVVAGACRRRRHMPSDRSSSRALPGHPSSNFLHLSALSRKQSEAQELQARERAREAAGVSAIKSILGTL
jgi:hypothetical protein